MKWKSSCLRKHWGIFRLVEDNLLNDIKLFHVFPICDGYMSSSLSVIFVTRGLFVYALGQNRCNMLGVGTNAYPRPIELPDLRGIDIQAIDTGLMHTLALTDNGCVFEWGLDVMEPYVEPLSTLPPKEVTWLNSCYKILQIACGSYFNLALTDTYTVIYWGYYDVTQNPLKRPISFSNEPSIISLSSGLFFSAAIGSSGKVYTWTGPKRDKWTCSPGFTTFTVTTSVEDVPLGRNMTRKERPLEPRCIPFPVEASMGVPLKVVCTLRSLYVLMDTGKAYVSGYLPSSFQLSKSIASHSLVNRTSARNLFSVTCSGYPVDIWGSRWNDNVTMECINPERFFVFTDNSFSPESVGSITEAFIDGPTPQMKSNYFIDQDFDESVYVTPRPQINQELFNSEHLSDIKFQLAEGQIPAHRYVLIAYSQHFRNMYSGSWKETTSNVIDVSKYNPLAFKAYVNYIYNGVLDKLPVVELLELYHLADEHMERPLKQLCLKEILQSNVESSTAAELYDWASCNDLKEFASKCVEYGASHLQDVLKSDGFANLSAERREVFVKELFTFSRRSVSSEIAF